MYPHRGGTEAQDGSHRPAHGIIRMLLSGTALQLQPSAETVGSAPHFSETNLAAIEYCFVYSTNKPNTPAAGRFMSFQLPGNGSAGTLMHRTGSYRKHTRTRQPFENAVQCKCLCYIA